MSNMPYRRRPSCRQGYPHEVWTGQGAASAGRADHDQPRDRHCGRPRSRKRRSRFWPGTWMTWRPSVKRFAPARPRSAGSGSASWHRPCPDGGARRSCRPRARYWCSMATRHCLTAEHPEAACWPNGGRRMTLRSRCSVFALRTRAGYGRLRFDDEGLAALVEERHADEALKRDGLLQCRHHGDGRSTARRAVGQPRTEAAQRASIT